MTLIKPLIVSVPVLVGMTIVANAQGQYRPYPPPQAYPSPQPYPYSQPYRQPLASTPTPAIPPSWYYNPYTSGEVGSPNRSGGS